MMTRIPFLMKRAELARSGLGSTVTIHWVSWAGGTVDPVTGANKGGVKSSGTLVVKALVHSIAAKSELKQFAEMKNSDVMVDFDADVALDGKQGLEFVIDGQRYTQKKLSDQVVKMFDVLVRDQKLHRTMVLELAT